MSDLVLIADGDHERGKLLAAACAANGIACRVTTHGAGALEAALAELPVVLVAQLDLPLIDAPQLAAILEANPRTQGIERVFLADRLSEARRTDIGGHLIPPAADAEEVAGIVQSLLAQREVRGEDAAEVSVEGGVEGQLAQLPLADLLQLFHVSRKTGTVEVMRGLLA